jgi:hypothetical protein
MIHLTHLTRTPLNIRYNLPLRELVHSFRSMTSRLPLPEWPRISGNKKIQQWFEFLCWILFFIFAIPVGTLMLLYDLFKKKSISLFESVRSIIYHRLEVLRQQRHTRRRSITDIERGDIPETKANLRKSPLLRLPAEVRQQIYGYIYQDTEVSVHIARNKFKTTFTARTTAQNTHNSRESPYIEGPIVRERLLAMPLTCRQM